MELADKYVYCVYQENSFSKAAKKLYISQSSLSATIKKLENKLGFLIFDRSKSPISLSREGRIYMKYIEEVLESETNMLCRIKSVSKPIDGHLSVGSAFFVSRYLLPKACYQFQRRFPGVELKLYMGETNLYSNLFERLDSGLLQLLIGFDFDEARYEGIPLLKEKYVVCLRRDFPGAESLKPYALSRNEILSNESFPDRIISDYKLFNNIDFIRINSTGIIWRDMGKFLSHCPVSPCSVYNCRNIDVIYDLMLCGIGAAVTTDSIIAYHPKNEDVLFFLIDTPKTFRQSFAIYKKDIPLSKSAKAFIETLHETCMQMKD